MYWSRTGSLTDGALFLLLCLMWGLGGWLVIRHAFRLREAERLLSGLAAGFLAFIGLANLLAHVMPLTPAYWAGSFLVLAGGLATAWRSSKRPWLAREDLRSWPQIAALLGLTVLFTLIGRGLALFDDYLHLPLVSTMAAGDIPPHFYLNPTQHFAYHYGLQVFAAGLVRIAGLFPWSAWDLSKAWAIALTMALSWLWVRRVTGSQPAATLGGFFAGFAGGTRWLLLFLPGSVLARMSNDIHLINTGADTSSSFISALSRPWLIEGGGPYPFPFAFHNSIFIPVIFSLGSSGAMPFMTLALLLLLTRQRRFSTAGTLMVSLAFATLALTAEHVFAFLWAGVAICGIISILRNRAQRKSISRQVLVQWGVVLFLSGVLSLVQGGFITETARQVLLRLQGVAPAITRSDYNYFSFGLRWPPVLVSGHFGDLSLLNPSHLLLLIFEIGPVLLLAPAVTTYSLRRMRRGDWLEGGLGIAALLSFLLVLFLRYGIERSTARLSNASLWIWALLGFPLVWQTLRRTPALSRLFLQAGLAITVFAGLVIFAVQLTSIPAPQLTYFVNSNDATLSKSYWDRLPKGAQVFDPIPYRAVTLFGRPARANLDIYESLPEWLALLASPDPGAIARAGYAFVYVDNEWWWRLQPEQRAAFKQPCVQVYARYRLDDVHFRWLLDVRGCEKSARLPGFSADFGG